MWKWTKDTITHVPREILWVLLGFAFGAGADVIAYFQSVPVYLYIPLGLYSFVLALAAVSLSLHIKDRSKKASPSGVSVEALESTISGWLLKAGYRITRSATPDSFFTLSAIDTLGRNVSVTRLKIDPDRLSIYEGYTLSNNQINALGSLSEDVSAEIFEDLRIDLANFDIELGAIPEKEDEPATIFYLRDRVVFEFLFNEDRFFERLSYVRRATTVVSEYLLRALRISEATSQENGT
ncbi:MAG: hypothetical protein CL696_13095 [Chloroflexi bacterium]|nr:hypothetical protein [Chloroflexota bacterium]|tara:strand:+ start:469 stop:1182 length:714 start_codon:yes stop_codon:yes gene_type:complete